MNTKAKGRRNELKAKKKLEAEGYQVQMVQRSTSRYAKQCDMFGLWDIIAVNDNQMRFIQVKTNRKMYGKQLIPYNEFQIPCCGKKEMWVYYDRVKEPEIIDLV